MEDKDRQEIKEMIRSEIQHRFKVIFIPLVIVIVLLSALALCCYTNQEERSHATEKPKPVSVAKSDTTMSPVLFERIKETKRQLLLQELSSRNNGTNTRSNMLAQYRLLFPVLLISTIGIFYSRKRSSENNNSRREALTNWMLPVLFIVVFFGYWWDNYILDLQDRVNFRVRYIYDVLTLLPEMQDLAKVNEIEILPTLEKRDVCQKICLLIRRQEFEQFVSYAPILLLSLFLICRAVSEHLRKTKKRQATSG